MKDFRFSYKFKMACKEDVLKLCPNIKKKYVAFHWFILLLRSPPSYQLAIQDVRRPPASARGGLLHTPGEGSEDTHLDCLVWI